MTDAEIEAANPPESSTMNRKQIPVELLVEGRWYAGRGRNANVALWGRIGRGENSHCTFLTIGFSFHQPNVKDEGYYMDERPLGKSAERVLMSYGCFQPFLLIEEGTVVEPVKPVKPGIGGWDQHYAKVLNV